MSLYFIIKSFPATALLCAFNNARLLCQIKKVLGIEPESWFIVCMCVEVAHIGEALGGEELLLFTI